LPSPVFLILLALTDGDAHGYDIRKHILARTDGGIDLDPGSLYRYIARLFHEGLIDERAAAAGDDRRRVYRLTVRGRRVLAAETDRMATLVAQARASARRRPKEA
jgi:DNA-binding PadR family transcriptional regulator